MPPRASCPNFLFGLPYPFVQDTDDIYIHEIYFSSVPQVEVKQQEPSSDYLFQFDPT